MGVKFLYGRDFLPEEGVLGKEHVVILINKLWKRLGSDPNIVGKPLKLDGTPYTVVGVMAPGQPDRLNQWLIVPLAFKPEQLNHDFHWLLAMGRLKPGVTIKQAQANMDAVTANIAKAFPKSNKGWGAMVEPLHNDFLPKERIQTLWMLLGAVGFVLLIACVNVANLLLAKGTTRHKEVAVRTALGATRKIIFAQFLTENLLLALIGGIAWTGRGPALAARAGGHDAAKARCRPRPTSRLNLPILLFSFAASTLAGLLFGCAPAWYATRVDPAEALKEGGRAGTGAGRQRLRRRTGHRRVRTGAGAAHRRRPCHPQLLESHQRRSRRQHHAHPDLQSSCPRCAAQGSSADHRLLSADTGQHQGRPRRAGRFGFGRIAAGGPCFGMPFTIAGQPEFADPSQRPGAGFGMVTPDYFKTYGIKVLRGRAFTDQDTAATVRVAMVNEKFVAQVFQWQRSAAATLMVEELIPGVTKLGPAVPWQIVGVFHNVRAGGFRDDFPEIEIPFCADSVAQRQHRRSHRGRSGGDDAEASPRRCTRSIRRSPWPSRARWKR